MKTLTYTGEGTYRGTDPETKNQVVVKKGRAVKVSETKAKQLLTDYPNAWTEGGKVADEPKADAGADTDAKASSDAKASAKKKGK
jgi:hypothetical protein